MSCSSVPPAFRRRLLSWFDENARDLPWRGSRDPYAIWVSEIMLQQTRVAAVLDHYGRFMQRFPTLHDLAGAHEDQVLAHWSGLGYYRRARLLHKAAQFVVHQLNGKLPQTAADLRVLSGVGEYTAAAIASIAFGEATACVDGNVERVLSRIKSYPAGEAAASKVRADATTLLDPARPGDFNQAMMELGALVCLPRSPLCQQCPVWDFCKTHGEHPVPERKKMRSRELNYAFMLRIAKRERARTHVIQVLLEKRSASEPLMPGMWELPELEAATSPNARKVLTLRHSITNTNYYVSIYEWPAGERTLLPKGRNSREWFMVEELHTLPLTGLARKVLKRLRAWPGYEMHGPVVELPGAPAQMPILPLSKFSPIR